jgi:geranylgeranyl diphosphate synthase, type II
VTATPSAAGAIPLAVWIDTRRALVEATLTGVLPGRPACPDVLDAALRHSMAGGGKRLRPLLTLASAEAIEPDSVRAQALALPAACAIELIHTYSLVHDDLPAMDNDSMRRGRPTSHVVFGDGMAILVGDGLLTEAFALLAREPVSDDAEIARRKLATLSIVAMAAGVTGMVGGQAIDLDAARPHGGGKPATFDGDLLRDMHAKKTGALITASVQAGASMAGADVITQSAIQSYGRELGLAFQIVDDVLDVEGTSAELGKTAGKDAAAGKPTYPAFFGVEESKQLARDAIERAKQTLTTAGLGGRLAEIADWVIHRTS